MFLRKITKIALHQKTQGWGKAMVCHCFYQHNTHELWCFWGRLPQGSSFKMAINSFPLGRISTIHLWHHICVPRYQKDVFPCVSKALEVCFDSGSCKVLWGFHDIVGSVATSLHQGVAVFDHLADKLSIAREVASGKVSVGAMWREKSHFANCRNDFHCHHVIMLPQKMLIKMAVFLDPESKPGFTSGFAIFLPWTHDHDDFWITFCALWWARWAASVRLDSYMNFLLVPRVSKFAPPVQRHVSSFEYVYTKCKWIQTNTPLQSLQSLQSIQPPMESMVVVIFWTIRHANDWNPSFQTVFIFKSQ